MDQGWRKPPGGRIARTQVKYAKRDEFVRLGMTPE